MKLLDAHGERAKGRRARGIDHAVRAAEVQAIGDPARDHVAEKTGESVLLPGRVRTRDPVADLLHFVFREAVLAQSAHPDGALKPRTHLDEQFLGRGDADDHAGALAEGVGEVSVGGVFEELLGHDQAEKL